jgi:hypothetical protein
MDDNIIIMDDNLIIMDNYIGKRGQGGGILQFKLHFKLCYKLLD